MQCGHLIRSLVPVATTLLSASLAPLVSAQEPAAGAVAQADAEALADAAFEVDPISRKEALTLFDEMVEAYRSGPLRDSFTLTTVTQAGERRSSEADEFTFLFDNDGRARLDMAELQFFIPGDGRVVVQHTSSPELYFQAEYAGELTNDVFLDNFELFPFPQLPLVLAEDALWEFFMLAPLEITGTGEQAVAGVTYRTLVLAGPESVVALRIHPETKLMHWMQVRFTGLGDMQRRMTFAMKPELLEALEPAEFAVDLSGYERVKELHELRPAEPESPAADAASPLVGRLLPVFHLPNLEGELVESVLLLDQALVLDLWATWCGPCRDALPYVDAAAQQAKQEGIPVRFFAVNVREQAESPEARVQLVRRFWKEQGLSMPVLIDHTGSLADKLHVGGIPCTVIVRPDGYVHAVRVGFNASQAENIAPALLEDVRAAIEAADNVEDDPF